MASISRSGGYFGGWMSKNSDEILSIDCFVVESMLWEIREISEVEVKMNENVKWK